jgi:hypothetical protein
MSDKFGRTEEELKEILKKNHLAERMLKLSYLDLDISELVFKKNMNEQGILEEIRLSALRKVKEIEEMKR